MNAVHSVVPGIASSGAAVDPRPVEYIQFQAWRFPPLRSQSELDALTDAFSQSRETQSATRKCGLVLIGLFLTLAAPLSAGEICMPAAELEAALIDWYAEQPTMVGPDGVVLWQSEDGASWTAVKYRDDGIACSIGNGLRGVDEFEMGEFGLARQ
ncbi:MAG: hypothetical protein AAGF27_01310 [Pseudomonadota bacterium]